MNSYREISAGLTLCLLLASCGEKHSSVDIPATEANKPVTAPPLSKFEQVKKAADNGDASAMLQVSKMYSDGKEVEQNASLSDAYLKKAVELNYPDAVYKLAENNHELLILDWAIKGKNDEEKFQNAQPLFKEAEKLFLQAVELGITKANQDLGFLYLNGLDDVASSLKVPNSKIPKELMGNIDKSIPFFEKAANLGMPRSMVVLYRLHSVAKFNHVDSKIAANWFNKIEALTDPKDLSTAADNLYYGTLAREGRFAAIDDFRPEPVWLREAQPLLERAADGGDQPSQVLLGRIFLNGFGGQKNEALAAKYLLKAGDTDTWAQVALGRLYMSGSGVLQDYSAAWKLFAKAANNIEFDNHVSEAQFLLGVLLEKGLGVTKDLVMAHAWYNIAAAHNFDRAPSRRDAITLQLNAEELAEAQALAKDWKPGVPLARNSSSPGISSSQADKTSIQKSGTGTLFYVNGEGMAITNSHVVAGCKEVKIEGSSDTAKVITQDTVNDLALVQVNAKSKQFANIIADPGKIRQGEEIVAFGFPLNSVLSSGGNLTPGVVSALTGLGNNTNQIQITAAIQPGSSGSPVINQKGNVIGVVAMKLSDSKMAKATGQVGQNVNFAVGGQTLRSFLDAHQVTYSSGREFLVFDKSKADIADEARKWTTVVECWK